MFATAPRVALSVAGLALIAAGAALWAHYGTLIYFDTIAAGFVGCLL